MPDSVLEAGNVAEKKTKVCSPETFILIGGDLRILYSHVGENEETNSVLEKE